VGDRPWRSALPDVGAVIRSLSPGDFVLGLVLLVATLGFAVSSAALLVRRRLSHLDGSARAVAIGTLSVAAILTVHLVPLALGVLSRGTVLATSAALLAGVLRWLRRPPGSSETPKPPPGSRTQSNVGMTGASNTVSFILAAAGVLLTVGWCLAYLRTHAASSVTSIDTLSFHLPGVIRFIQSGTLWQLTHYVPGQAQGNYPQYGDLLLLAVVLPWHSVAFIRYVDPVMLGLAAVATYAIARELRAPAGIAALITCGLFSLRPAVGPAFTDVITDPTFLAGFAAGTLFLLRHWRTGQRSDLLLAGLGLGIALGTKWYGLTDVPALWLIWVVATRVVRKPRRPVLADAGLLAGVIALSGGVWMLRNLILTGNPVFDYKVSLLGFTVFPAPPSNVLNQTGFTIAHYLGDSKVLRQDVWPVFRADFGLVSALIIASVLTAGALWLQDRRRGSERRLDPRLALLSVAALVAAVAYAITPYSAGGFRGAPVLLIANTRYGVPALLLAAPVAAVVAGRAVRARVPIEIVLLVLTVLNLRRSIPMHWTDVAALTGVLAGIAAAWHWASRTPKASHWVLVRPALVTALLAAGIALSYHWQRVLGSAPYAPDDPTVDYVLAHNPANTRIAVTGDWTTDGLVPLAPLYGPRLNNTLDYLGPVVEHRLEEYSSAAAFEQGLRQGHYQLLVVGKGVPPVSDPDQVRWAQSAGYVQLVQSPRLVLLRAPRS
jgi:hypothetical protein